MIERFLDILCDATARIEPIYSQLPTVGREEAIIRERVYAYELYHQMRGPLAADRELRDYMFSGELDKSGHAIIRVPARNVQGWRSCIPDFVLHEPGNMDSNLAVVEVKPANGAAEGIGKDLETLSYFVTDEVGYGIGVELVYGGSERDLDRFITPFRNANNAKLRVYWHGQGQRAQRVL